MKCQFGSLYRSWKLISIKKKRVFCCILLLFVLYKRYFSDSIFYISSDMFCLFLSSSDYKVILYNLEDWNFFFCFSFPIIFFSLKKCSIKKTTFYFWHWIHFWECLKASMICLYWEFIRDNMWWGNISPPSSEHTVSFNYFFSSFNLKETKYY